MDAHLRRRADGLAPRPARSPRASAGPYDAQQDVFFVDFEGCRCAPQEHRRFAPRCAPRLAPLGRRWMRWSLRPLLDPDAGAGGRLRRDGEGLMDAIYHRDPLHRQRLLRMKLGEEGSKRAHPRALLRGGASEALARAGNPMRRRFALPLRRTAGSKVSGMQVSQEQNADISRLSRQPTSWACACSQVSARARPVRFFSRATGRWRWHRALLALPASPSSGASIGWKRSRFCARAADRRPARTLGDELAGVGDHAHLAQEGGGESRAHAACRDVFSAAGACSCCRGFSSTISGPACRIRKTAGRSPGWQPAVPVVLAVDLHRVMQRGQAGRGQHSRFVEFGGAEEPDLAGAHRGGGDERA